LVSIMKTPAQSNAFQAETIQFEEESIILFPFLILSHSFTKSRDHLILYIISTIRKRDESMTIRFSKDEKPIGSGHGIWEWSCSASFASPFALWDRSRLS
jgi:hypothetical protein